MKTSHIFLLSIGWVIIAVTAFFAGASHNKNSNVELPEEYKLITKETPIQGVYKNDTLFIEFKHNYK